MREFFCGWRRNAGCGLLVMALLFAGGWIRSLRRGDVVTLSMGKLALGVHSHSGGLKVLVYHIFGQGLNGMFAGERNAWISYEIDSIRADISADEAGEVIPMDRYDHEARFCGVVLTRYSTFAVIVDANETETRSEVTSLEIPYGYIAVPLTLLSAYLILWKPRKKA